MIYPHSANTAIEESVYAFFEDPDAPEDNGFWPAFVGQFPEMTSGDADPSQVVTSRAALKEVLLSALGHSNPRLAVEVSGTLSADEAMACLPSHIERERVTATIRQALQRFEDLARQRFNLPVGALADNAPEDAFNRLLWCGSVLLQNHTAAPSAAG